MKNFLFFAVLCFLSVNSLRAQTKEEANYLKVIALSLPDQYIKSNSELFFTIQIGAYQNENKTLETLANVTTTKEDTLNKYRLGEFLTYKEAVEYKNMLLSVCNDAFIVPIKNGKRIHIKEALKLGAI
ncbi:MAG: hypothetical protein ABJH82_01980 [Polaribacter sp.]|uniref:hypothetical protein n=1 Tax=Polaribacter sp. TaxID=1920175 RepID=UPI003262F96A